MASACCRERTALSPEKRPPLTTRVAVGVGGRRGRGARADLGQDHAEGADEARGERGERRGVAVDRERDGSVSTLETVNEVPARTSEKVLVFEVAVILAAVPGHSVISASCAVRDATRLIAVAVPPVTSVLRAGVHLERRGSAGVLAGELESRGAIDRHGDRGHACGRAGDRLGERGGVGADRDLGQGAVGLPDGDRRGATGQRRHVGERPGERDLALRDLVDGEAEGRRLRDVRGARRDGRGELVAFVAPQEVAVAAFVGGLARATRPWCSAPGARTPSRWCSTAST